MDSFFYSQGSYIYFHIYSLYKVSVIFGHSDMFICLILHIFVNVLVPFFFKKMSLPHISFRHLVEVMSFVVFWDGFEGDRVLSLEFGRRGMLVFLVFWVFVVLLQVKGLLVDRHVALLQVKGL